MCIRDSMRGYLGLHLTFFFRVIVNLESYCPEQVEDVVVVPDAFNFEALL